MFHVKDDFSKGPISQVPASWFNSVGKFLNNLVGSGRVKLTKNDDGTPSSIELIGEDAAGGMGTPVDNTNASEEGSSPDPFGLTFTNWDAGTDNGVKIRLYGLVELDGFSHIFQPVDLEITNDGRVKSVKVPSGNHGIFIGA